MTPDGSFNTQLFMANPEAVAIRSARYVCDAAREIGSFLTIEGVRAQETEVRSDDFGNGSSSMVI